MPVKNCSFNNINAQQQEIEARGTPMFPCGGYTTSIGDCIGRSIPWHWHEEVEVLAVCEGALQLNLPGQCYAIQSGEGAFINAGVLQSAVKLGEEDCTIQSFVFHPSIISGMIESIFEQRYVRPLLQCDKLPGIHFGARVDWHTEAVQCILEAFQLYQSEPFGFELFIREKLSRVWFLMVSHHRDVLREQQRPHHLDSLRLKDMLTYIHANYADQIGLHHIAAAAAISERECLRCFKRVIGITPMKYLLRHRISIAAELLAHFGMNITEISRNTGFDSPSYFSATFKKMIGMTPKEYRDRTDTSKS